MSRNMVTNKLNKKQESKNKAKKQVSEDESEHSDDERSESEQVTKKTDKSGVYSFAEMLFRWFTEQIDGLEKAGVPVDEYSSNLRDHVKDDFVKLVIGNLPKSRSMKALRDPNAPKKARSGYILYGMENRPRIVKKVKKEGMEGKEGNQEVMKRLGQEWNALTDEEKEPFLEAEAKEKRRFDKQMKKYVEPEEVTRSKEMVKDRNKQMRRGKPKDENAPKRPVSAYFLFCKSRRAEDDKEKLSNKVLIEEWRALKSGKKKVFEDKYAKIKAAYDKELKKYKKTEEFQEWETAVAEWKAKGCPAPPEKPKRAKSAPAPKSGSKRSRSASASTKRGPTGYNLFITAMKKKHPKKDFAEIQAMWKLADKEPWNEKAKEAKESTENEDEEEEETESKKSKRSKSVPAKKHDKDDDSEDESDEEDSKLSKDDSEAEEETKAVSKSAKRQSRQTAKRGRSKTPKSITSTKAKSDDSDSDSDVEDEKVEPAKRGRSKTIKPLAKSKTPKSKSKTTMIDDEEDEEVDLDTLQSKSKKRGKTPKRQSKEEDLSDSD